MAKTRSQADQQKTGLRAGFRLWNIMTTIPNSILTTHPVDRIRRIEDLQLTGLMTDDLLASYSAFVERHGLIAPDLGIFVYPTGLYLTWNVSIQDIREGGRKRNTVIVSCLIAGDTVFVYPDQTCCKAFKVGDDGLDQFLKDPLAFLDGTS